MVFGSRSGAPEKLLSGHDSRGSRSRSAAHVHRHPAGCSGLLQIQWPSAAHTDGRHVFQRTSANPPRMLFIGENRNLASLIANLFHAQASASTHRSELLQFSTRRIDTRRVANPPVTMMLLSPMRTLLLQTERCRASQCMQRGGVNARVQTTPQNVGGQHADKHQGARRKAL